MCLSTAYGVGSAAVFVISLASLVGVVTVPFLGKKFMGYITSFLVPMGVSALACSSVLYLIPTVSTAISITDSCDITY